MSRISRDKSDTLPKHQGIYNDFKNNTLNINLSPEFQNYMNMLYPRNSLINPNERLVMKHKKNRKILYLPNGMVIIMKSYEITFIYGDKTGTILYRNIFHNPCIHVTHDNKYIAIQDTYIYIHSMENIIESLNNQRFKPTIIETLGKKCGFQTYFEINKNNHIVWSYKSMYNKSRYLDIFVIRQTQKENMIFITGLLKCTQSSLFIFANHTTFDINLLGLICSFFCIKIEFL